MNPKERMKIAMNLEEPDRVPVMYQMSIGHMLLQTGFSPSEFWLSAEFFAEGLLKLRKIYEFDGILISLHGHSPHWKRNVVKIQAEEKEEVVCWSTACSIAPQTKRGNVPVLARVAEETGYY